MKSDAATPEQYLHALPSDRRELVETVRRTILDHLPAGYEELMSFGMITYAVPLAEFPGTYNGQPLGAVAIASQKRYVSVYLMGIYGDEREREWFVDAWTASGTKLDMGKSCVRFTKLDGVALDVLGAAVARVTPDQLIAAHEAAHGAS